MSKLDVEIVTPVNKFYEGEAYMVVVPGEQGSLGFLPGHVPYVCPLGEGCVSVSQTNKSQDGKCFNINGGYVQVSKDKIIILAEHVEEQDA